MKHLVIVGGTMGIGKTAICRELQKTLPNNVFLDGDWCWNMRPFLVTEETKAMVRGNIEHLLNSFLACPAFENVIFCWVLHESAILDDLLSSLNLADCVVHCFSLVCSEKALAQRLRRDIAAGLRESDMLERSLARLPMYNALDTAKIDVSDISASEAAQMILSAMAGVSSCRTP